MIERKYFITVTANGVSVGGQIATKYHGYDITDVDKLPEGFCRIQREIEYLGCEQKLAEIHILSSQTPGRYRNVIDNPSPLSGQFFYVQFVFEGGIQSRWGCVNYWTYASDCIRNCARSVCVGSAGQVIDELVYDLFPNLKNRKGLVAVPTRDGKNTEPTQSSMGILDPAQLQQLTKDELIKFLEKLMGEGNAQGN